MIQFADGRRWIHLERIGIDRIDTNTKVVFWESEEMRFLVHWNFISQAGAARYIRGELELTELTQTQKLCFGEQEKSNSACIWIPEFAENRKSTDSRIGIGIAKHKTNWTSVCLLQVGIPIVISCH